VVDFDVSRHTPFAAGSPTGNMVGHYTAAIWADTNLVGCGMALCHDPAA